MKLFESLDKEWNEPGKGTYAPYYFRYLGYKKDLAASPAVLRANGICALFTETTPVILKSEWIAGNKKSLFCEENEIVLRYAKELTDTLLHRVFRTNADHFAPHYEHVLAVGIGGLKQEIDVSLKKYVGDADKTETLCAMKQTLCAFSTMIENYASAAEAAMGKEGFDDRRLRFMADNCHAIADGAPQNFAQALQLVWFCHLAFRMEGRAAMALGRLDQYLYPFYKADTEAGRIGDEEVIELLKNVFVRLRDGVSNDIVNICLGGQNAKGECQINPLSYCIVRAVRNCNFPGPNLSLRYTENTPDDFLDECLKTIGTGLGYLRHS